MMQMSIEITDFLCFWIREREKWKGNTQWTRFMVLLFLLALSVSCHDFAEPSTSTAFRGFYPHAPFKTGWGKVSAIDEWELGPWINLGRNQSCFSSHLEHESSVVCALVPLPYPHGHHKYWSLGRAPQTQMLTHEVKMILLFLNLSTKARIPLHSSS